MRKRVGTALMLGMALMLGSVNVGAVETDSHAIADTEISTVQEEVGNSDQQLQEADPDTDVLSQETTDSGLSSTEDEKTDETVIEDVENGSGESVVLEDTPVATQAAAAEITLVTETTETSDSEKAEAADAEEEVAADTVVEKIGPVSVQANGQAYVSDENGNRVTTAGTPIINGKKYYVAGDGYLVTGWLILTDWKMYFSPEDYAAQVGMSDIDGKRYLFNDDGVMQTYAGTTIVNGKKYWFSDDNASLKSGWLNLGDWKLYFDPVTYEAKIGLCEVEGHMYIFNSDGVMQGYPGTPVIDGKKYWVAEEGYLKSGWLNLGNWKMYFDPETYAARTGITDLNGKKYLFNKDGVMQTYAGTTVIDGKKYWFSDDDASLKCGWLNLGSWKLYFDPETYAAVTGLVTIGENKYYFNSDGVMLTGVIQIGSAFYYFNEDGIMLTDCECKIDGRTYQIDSNGVIQGYQVSESVAYAKQVLDQVGWDLSAAFQWSAGLTYANRALRAPSGTVHTDYYATYGFKNKSGNCYVMAATFYQMAKLLGYEVYFVEGSVPLRSGGMGDHGWCEIVMDGTTYVFDPNFTNETGRNGYQITYGASGTWRYSNYKRVD